MTLVPVHISSSFTQLHTWPVSLVTCSVDILHCLQFPVLIHVYLIFVCWSSSIDIETCIMMFICTALVHASLHHLLHVALAMMFSISCSNSYLSALMFICSCWQLITDTVCTCLFSSCPSQLNCTWFCFMMYSNSSLLLYMLELLMTFLQFSCSLPLSLYLFTTVDSLWWWLYIRGGRGSARVRALQPPRIDSFELI